MNALDTNIFLYAVDDNEPTKQAKARMLIQQLVGASEPTVLLWQVLAETGKPCQILSPNARLQFIAGFSGTIVKAVSPGIIFANPGFSSARGAIANLH